MVELCISLGAGLREVVSLSGSPSNLSEGVGPELVAYTEVTTFCHFDKFCLYLLSPSKQGASSLFGRTLHDDINGMLLRVE